MMKERAVGFLLMCFVVPMAVAGYLLLVWVGLFGPNARGRAGVRALDHYVNATIFNGYAWESVSSHAWRELGHRPAAEGPLPARQQARAAGGRPDRQAQARPPDHPLGHTP
jgi:hypothetical protein